MIDLSAKKEKLLQHVRNDDFFSGGVLANEIPFYIFDYDSKDELALRHLTSEFDKELKNKWHNVLHINLYELVIELLTEKFWPRNT